MEREPAERYPSAAAMKADLDAPERVHVTGRAQRLKVPGAAPRRWRFVRLVLLAALAPIALFFLILFFLTHR